MQMHNRVKMSSLGLRPSVSPFQAECGKQAPSPAQMRAGTLLNCCSDRVRLKVESVDTR